MGWPLDKIAQIYDYHLSPDTSVCSEFRRFSSQDIPVVRIVKRLLGKPGQEQHQETSSKNALENGRTSFGLLAACGDLAPLTLSKPLADWISDFRPDVIYSVLGSGRMISLVSQISKGISAPIVPHFMDDWPDILYSRSTTLAIPRSLLNRRLLKLLATCSGGLAICEDMSNEMSKRYKIPFDHFMNCVALRPESSSVTNTSNKTTFGFAGGLHLNRWQSLVSLATALQNLYDRGEQVQLNIYTLPADLSKYESLFRKFTVVGDLSSLKASEVDDKLQLLDVPVHVESFTAIDSQYTRLSISTKIPQYMASGKPILAIGPKGLSSIKYIERTNSGLVCVNEHDIEEIEKISQSLISSKELRATLGSNGRRNAQLHHDADTERIRFRRFLQSATTQNN